MNENKPELPAWQQAEENARLRLAEHVEEAYQDMQGKFDVSVKASKYGTHDTISVSVTTNGYQWSSLTLYSQAQVNLLMAELQKVKL